MKSDNTKINFLKKIKISIFNLEKYGMFIGEYLGKSIKYMFLLILIFTICYTGIYIYDTYKMVNKAVAFIENEMPDFVFEDGNLKFENELNGYDNDYDFKIVNIGKNELEDKEKNEYYKYSKSLILLNDKIIFLINGESIEYSYDYIQQTFGTQINNKQELIQSLNNLGGKNQLILVIGITLFISFLTINTYQIIIDCLIVAIYGYLVARINRIKIKFSTATTLSIYSLTLPTILNAIYVVVYYFTKFEIEYFNWLYIIIAYIYITAAILMIKTDLINQMIEFKKVELQKANKNEEEKVDEKTLEKDKEKKDKEENKNQKEDDVDINEEPDGSEI